MTAVAASPVPRAFPLLALDLGTRCGYAVVPPAGALVSGTLDLASRRFEGGGMRYLRFRKALDEMHGAWGGFSHIVFEEVRRHAGTDAAHVYGGLLAIMSTWAEERSIPFEGISVGTWKKALGVKGNAAKEAVKAAVQELGFAPASFDEADAIGIALCADRRSP